MSPPKSADAPGGTPELRALLVGYAGELEAMNSMPTLFWIRPEKRRPLRWLRLPALNRFVQAFFVRYLDQCIGALKSGVVRRGALSVNGDAHDRDLEMLERFEQSLPSKMRIALIWPKALFGLLLVSYGLATLFQADYSKLLGGLAGAALKGDRAGAWDAFDHFARMRDTSYLSPFFRYASAAILFTWAAILLIAPLLPAFAVNRRARARLAHLERRAFAAVGASTVNGIELDLIARLLLLPAVGVSGILLLLGHEPVSVGRRVTGDVCVVLTILAAIELRVRYTKRRSTAEPRRHHLLGRISLSLVSVLGRVSLSLASVVSLLIFVSLPISMRPRSPDTWSLYVADGPRHPWYEETGWIYDIYFAVTAIERDVECNDTYGRFVGDGDPQFLRFSLETWSSVDQFAEPAAAHWLTLHHWSVLDDRGSARRLRYMHPACGRGTAAISQPVIPGDHTTTVVVVSAPKSAAFLRLSAESYPATWQWRIPPNKR
jgi:hypothetical protein